MPDPISNAGRIFSLIFSVICVEYVYANFWPHRLTVRTPGSHPGNRSSILLEATNS